MYWAPDVGLRHLNEIRAVALALFFNRKIAIYPSKTSTQLFWGQMHFSTRTKLPVQALLKEPLKDE